MVTNDPDSIEGEFSDATPKMLQELEQRRKKERLRERKRDAALRVRDVQSRERIFMLAYMCMLVVVFLGGLVVGRLWR